MRCAAALLAMLLAAFGLGAALAQTSDELEPLRNEAEQLFSQRKYAEALAVRRSLAAAIEKAETAEAGSPARRTAEALGSLAWYALFSREHAEALAASERGRTLAPELLAIETNRAHALLFLDRGSDAREIYLAHKGKRLDPSSDTTWEDVIAEDFDALTGAGIQHSAFAEIIAALGIENTELNKDIAAARGEVEQLYTAGKYAEAVTAAEKYVDLTRQRFGEERSEFAAAITWAAMIHEKLNRVGQAVSLYERALPMWEKALGANHRDFGSVLNNLARLYMKQERYTEGERLHKRSIFIFENFFGAEHPRVNALLNWSASLIRYRV